MIAVAFGQLGPGQFCFTQLHGKQRWVWSPFRTGWEMNVQDWLHTVAGASQR